MTRGREERAMGGAAPEVGASACAAAGAAATHGADTCAVAGAAAAHGADTCAAAEAAGAGGAGAGSAGRMAPEGGANACAATGGTPGAGAPGSACPGAGAAVDAEAADVDVVVAANADEARDVAAALALEACAAGRRACVVTPAGDLAAEATRALAADGGALGAEALPWDAWLADRWELWGDGRRLVGEGERVVLTAAALDDALGAEATPGRAALLADLAAEDLPALLDEARRGDDLAPDELRVLDAARRYAGELAARGLVEASEACALLVGALAAGAAGDGARLAGGALRAGTAEGAPDAPRDGVAGGGAALAAPAGALPPIPRAAWEDVVALGFEEGDLARPQAALLAAAGARMVANGRATARVAPRAPELEALLDALYRPDPAHPVEPTGAVRCALATGATVEARLIADVALELAAEAAAAARAAQDAAPGGGAPAADAPGAFRAAAEAEGGALRPADGAPLVVVAATDPAALFDDVADELATRGVAVELAAAVPLPRTEAGRLLWALADALEAEAGRDAADAAADVALSAASGVRRGAAFRADRQWRRDRLTLAAAVRADLGALDADVLEPILGDLAVGRLVTGLSALASALAAGARDEGGRAAAAAALAPVLAAAPAAEEAGLSLGRLAALLSGRAAPLSLRVDPPAPASDAAAPGDAAASAASPALVTSANPAASTLASLDGPVAPAPAAPVPVVLLTTLERAARLAPGAAHGLVVCGLTSAERPVRAAEDAESTLLAKLGAAAPADPLAAMRRRLRDALEAARATVVLERALNGVGAEPRYAATLLEEVADCYRDDLRTDAGIDRDLGIPAPLVPFARTLAESRFVYGACGADAQPAGLTVPAPETGAIGEALAPFITLPRGPASVTREGLDLSPSAIESYLDCPYRWFVQRRLALAEPDEGFGVLERGTFVHEVLQALYLRLRDEGVPRVTAESVPRALEVLDAVFDDACAAQGGRRPGHRYVPVDRRERDLREALRPLLARYVAAEASFLPGFAPAYLEWSYNQDEAGAGGGGGVPYAGHWLVGTVDRIDVDAEGRAVVIDYKTSLGPAYHLHGRDVEPDEPFALPRKMQALIYARVAERLLGVRVVATLYVNPLRRAVAGAFDARALDAAAVPGLDPDRSRVPYGAVGSFPELLDRAEGEVARRLASLAAGDIRPAPSDAEACRYCPAVICERRL